MNLKTILFALALGAAAASCGGDVCEELGDAANSCFNDPACDSMPSCAEAKANRGQGEAVACEGAVKVLAEACDQSTITPANNCSCSLN
jgi:hypothetical protein